MKELTIIEQITNPGILILVGILIILWTGIKALKRMPDIENDKISQ